MTDIDVEPLGGDDPRRFSVRVTGDGTSTTHEVTLGERLRAQLASEAKADAVVAAVFRFLLDREPKEAILGRFDVSVVSRYFPEFERQLPTYL